MLRPAGLQVLTSLTALVLVAPAAADRWAAERPIVNRTLQAAPTPEPNLAVTRFILAAALGDRHTACALFPTHRPYQRGERFVGPGDFRLLAITLIDPDHATVSAYVGDATGSFALTRVGRSFVISQATGALARVPALWSISETTTGPIRSLGTSGSELGGKRR